MTKYEVLASFTDLKDNNKKYVKGNVYPSPVNKRVSKARIKELSSTKNKQGKKLIEEMKVVEEQE